MIFIKTTTRILTELLDRSWKMFAKYLVVAAIASTALASWDVIFYSEAGCGGAATAASGAGSSSCASFSTTQMSLEVLSFPGCTINLYIDNACQTSDGGPGVTGQCITSAAGELNSYSVDCVG